MGSVVRGVVLGGGLLPLEAAVKVEGVQAREGKVEWREGQVSTGSRCGTSGRRSLIRSRAARGLLTSPGVAPLLRHHPYSSHPHCVRRGAVVCLIAIPNQRFSSAGIPPRSGLLSYERKPRRGQRFAHLPGGHFSGIVQARGKPVPLSFLRWASLLSIRIVKQENPQGER